MMNAECEMMNEEKEMMQHEQSFLLNLSFRIPHSAFI
jgi:hypothetical protein